MQGVIIEWLLHTDEDYNNDCCIVAPDRPPPPIHGKVTHHSIELNWEEAIKRAMTNYTRADGRIKVTLQEEDRHGNWVNVYR